MQLELSVLAQVFRIALGAFSLGAWSQLELWGGPRIVRWAFLGTASLTRTAIFTFPEHAEILERMQQHVVDHPDWRTLCVLASKKLYPDLWQSEAFVETLAAAAAGYASASSSSSC